MPSTDTSRFADDISSTPLISIVVPSYNQADYLRKCLESVVSQQYQNLELIVIDGGSTDHSVEVIREFEKHIAWWVSEPDDGQTDAINKGLRQATGEVWSFLNSDDLLEPDCLAHVGEYFAEHLDAEWLSGRCRVFGSDIEEWQLIPLGVTSLTQLLTPWNRPGQYIFPQSGACFMRKSVIDQVGYFDPSYHYSMDMEFYTRAYIQGQIQQHITTQCLAAWRLHREAKTFLRGIAYAFREDEIRIANRYINDLPDSEASEVKREIRNQTQALYPFKAMWFLNHGSKGQALQILLQGLSEYPTSVLTRPWLGAFRTLCFRAIKLNRNDSSVS